MTDLSYSLKMDQYTIRKMKKFDQRDIQEKSYRFFSRYTNILFHDSCTYMSVSCIHVTVVTKKYKINT